MVRGPRNGCLLEDLVALLYLVRLFLRVLHFRGLRVGALVGLALVSEVGLLPDAGLDDRLGIRERRPRRLPICLEALRIRKLFHKLFHLFSNGIDATKVVVDRGAANLGLAEPIGRDLEGAFLEVVLERIRVRALALRHEEAHSAARKDIRVLGVHLGRVGVRLGCKMRAKDDGAIARGNCRIWSIATLHCQFGPTQPKRLAQFSQCPFFI